MLKRSQRMLNYLSVFSNPRETQGECSKKQYQRKRGKQNPRTPIKKSREENYEFKTKELARIIKVFHIVIKVRGGERSTFFFPYQSAFVFFSLLFEQISIS